MSGFEAATGLISLSLTLFKGCIQAFQFVETAAQLGGDADIIRCKLEWEQYRLCQWAEQVGLEDHPDSRLNWTLASNCLKQLDALLTSSKEWKERYHLDVVESDKAAGISGSTASPAMSPRRSGFGLLLAQIKPNHPLTSSRIIHESNGPIKRLEWAAVGRDKLHRLVEDISYFNNCLHSLLDSTDRNFIGAAIAALLRDIISRSDVSSELDIVKELLQSTSVASPEAVASAASLKKIRLILGLGKSPTGPGVRQSSSKTDVKLRLIYLKPKHFIRESMYIHPRGREVARYKSDPVLVEWRFIKKDVELQLKSKIDQLAILLGNTDYSSFHSLHCVGILPKDDAYKAEEDSQVCYGFVFDLRIPQSAVPSSKSPVVLTLSDLYMLARKPSLNERLDIAIALCETVLQLHTTGWLHKGIHPDNILFLELNDHTWRSSTAQGPFLAGYEYTRPSNGETEAMPGHPNLDLYRHPLAQGPARSTFNRSFDLFALGCVLLEIALWTNLRNILGQATQRENGQETNEKQRPSRKDCSISSEWTRINASKDQMLQNDQNRGELANLAFHAGETFKEVILLCLYASVDNPDDQGLESQQSVVDKLKDCRY